MTDSALIIGIVIMLSVVAIAVLVGVVTFARRRSASGRPGNRDVPPPVDPGPTHPEQAKDVNAEK